MQRAALDILNSSKFEQLSTIKKRNRFSFLFWLSGWVDKEAAETWIIPWCAEGYPEIRRFRRTGCVKWAHLVWVQKGVDGLSSPHKMIRMQEVLSFRNNRRRILWQIYHRFEETSKSWTTFNFLEMMLLHLIGSVHISQKIWGLSIIQYLTSDLKQCLLSAEIFIKEEDVARNTFAAYLMIDSSAILLDSFAASKLSIAGCSHRRCFTMQLNTN